MSHLQTLCARIGTGIDKTTGAISFPIYQTSTFEHPGLGLSTGFDYSRTINPTRKVLEDALARLEDGTRGFAFTSGMAAITTLLTLFGKDQRIMFSEDLYGGTYRIMDKVFTNFGLSPIYVDTTDPDKVRAAMTPDTAGILIESPTNPTMRISDIRSLASIAHGNGSLLIVDNTFLTPCLQRPLSLGADIVVHSATKSLAGHNDLLSGAIVVRDTELGDRLFMLQNSLGAVLAPFDSWLLMRGLKTLPLRIRQQVESADAIARWLKGNPKVKRVYYPGLEDHTGYGLNRSQATGAGSIISFELESREEVAGILQRLRIISYAESLGGVESLMTFPFTQTHKDIPETERNRLGVTEGLLRFSVGIEDTDDLIGDLTQALA